MGSETAQRALTVCTLFEGDYHHGLAALVNSLVRAGYKGDFWVGYRGELPIWLQRGAMPMDGGSKLPLATGASINLIRLDTKWHLTNYKPIFIADLLDDPAVQSDGVFYFDPDITVRGSWSFFERWIGHGIALCGDVNSPMHARHPKRLDWRKSFPELEFHDDPSGTYVNGGFIGVTRQTQDFLQHWRSIIEKAAAFTGGPDKWYSASGHDPGAPFSTFDQDALNVAMSTTPHPVSIVGPEGMDFRGGGYLMSHAVGSSKPWRGSYLGRVLAGRRIGLAEAQYMQAARGGVVASTGKLHQAAQRGDFLLAKILGRLIT